MQWMLFYYAWAANLRQSAVIQHILPIKILLNTNILQVQLSIIKFRNGTVGKVASVIDCLQPYYFHFHLVGSEGSLLDNKFYSTKLGGLNKNKWSELSMKMLDSGDVSDHPYQVQFEAFFKAVDEGKEMPLTSLADALKTHELVFAADKSADQNATKNIK